MCVDSTEDYCPDCDNVLEIVENFGMGSEYKTYGCEKCDKTFLLSTNYGCASPGGFREQLQTLTELKKEIADRPQAEIRRKRNALEAEINDIDLKIEALEKKRLEPESKLRELQEELCQHPNKRAFIDVKDCSDCGWWEVIPNNLQDKN